MTGLFVDIQRVVCDYFLGQVGGFKVGVQLEFVVGHNLFLISISLVFY